MRFLLLLVAACGSASAPDPAPEPLPAKAKPPVDVPDVNQVGTAIAFAPRGMTVMATRNAVVIDGNLIASITNGALDPAELEGGALGLKLARLTSFTQAWVAESTTKGIPADETGLLLERTLTYHVLIQLMYSIKVAGVRRFAIAAQHNGELVALPVVLPDHKPAAAATTDRQPGRDLGAQIDALVKEQTVTRGVPDKPRVTIEAKSAMPALSLTVDAIAMKIQSAYLRGIERCAKAKATETVTLGFTVAADGRAMKPKISGTSPSARACMAGSISGWRFAIPRTAAGEPGETVAQIVLEIAPAEEELASTISAVALQGSGGEAEMGQRNPGKDLNDLVDPSPRMVVSVTDTQLRVWSINALEGTLTHPKLAVPLGPTGIEAVRTELENLVKRRWQGKPRPAASREIVLMPTAKTSLQTVVEQMFAIRETRDRLELFPDIQLSSGFE